MAETNDIDIYADLPKFSYSETLDKVKNIFLL